MSYTDKYKKAIQARFSTAGYVCSTKKKLFLTQMYDMEEHVNITMWVNSHTETEVNT